MQEFQESIVGMLGEAVTNPEMAQRYVNTHTHTHTRVQKHILFKNSFKIHYTRSF